MPSNPPIPHALDDVVAKIASTLAQSYLRRPQGKPERWARPILVGIRKRWPWVKHLFADFAYDRTHVMDKAAFLDFVIEVVRRLDDEPSFNVALLGRGTHLRLALPPPGS